MKLRCLFSIACTLAATMLIIGVAAAGSIPDDWSVEINGKAVKGRLDDVLPGSRVKISSPLISIVGNSGVLRTDLLLESEGVSLWEISSRGATAPSKYKTAEVRLQPGDYSILLIGLVPPTETVVDGERKDRPREVVLLTVDSEKGDTRLPLRYLSSRAISTVFMNADSKMTTLESMLKDDPNASPAVKLAAERAREELNLGRPANSLRLTEATASLYVENRELENSRAGMSLVAIIEGIVLVVAAAFGVVLWRQRSRDGEGEAPEGESRSRATQRERDQTGSASSQPPGSRTAGSRAKRSGKEEML